MPTSVGSNTGCLLEFSFTELLSISTMLVILDIIILDNNTCFWQPGFCQALGGTQNKLLH